VGLQPSPSTIASNVSPSASIKINRAFRASSARLLRERTRNSSASRIGRVRTTSALEGMRHDARSHYRFQRYSALGADGLTVGSRYALASSVAATSSGALAGAAYNNRSERG